MYDNNKREKFKNSSLFYIKIKFFAGIGTIGLLRLMAAIVRSFSFLYARQFFYAET